MKKHCLLLAVLSTGCAGARIDDLEQRMNSELRQMREEIAGQNNQIEELRSQLGKVTGRVEEVQHVAVGRTSELEQNLQRVSSRMPPPPPVPEDLLNLDESSISRQNGPAAELFLGGLKQLRSGDFSGARDTFSRFVDENPSTAFTDNGYFWQGISYEGLGQLDRAVAAYSLGFQKFPAEDRVPASLYKLGDVFDQLNQKKDALLTFEKLVEEHPSSDYAAKARARLSALRPTRTPPKSKRR